MTTSYYIREFILYFSIVQSFILAFYFFSTKQEQRSSNKILALALFSYGLFVLATALYYDKLFGLTDYKKWFFNFRELFNLSLFALLYFYIRSLLNKHFSIKRKSTILHTLPLIAISFYLHFKLNTNPMLALLKSGFFYRLGAFNLIYDLFYLSLIYYILFRKYKSFRHFFSKDNISNYKWLCFLLGCFVVLWLCELSVFILGITKKLTAALPIISSIYTLVPFIFINSLLLIVLLAPKLYLFKKNGNSHAKNDPEQKELLDRLLTLLDKEKIFTDSELSLQKASILLKINQKNLSALINEKLGQSFSDLINTYRINESKKLLIDKPQKTVQEIMYEIGFNSKSAFNQHFKNSTGLTPKQFRLKR